MLMPGAGVAAREVGQQRGQVHRLAARGELVRVGLGQHQQLGDELFQAL